MAPNKEKVNKNDPDLHKKAQNFSAYIDIVRKKIQDNKIEDIVKIGINLQKCVSFFALYIKYMPEYSDKVMYMCRSILILIESKNLIWDVKDFAKLVITCCLIMVFQKDEEIIRESCIVTKEVLLKVYEDSLLEGIVLKCSNYIILLMQRVLSVRTRLSQAMILEVMFELTKNSKQIRNDALKKQNFFTSLDPSVSKLLMKSFTKIDHENIEETSRGFFMTLNMIINQKCGIFTTEGCVYKVNDVEKSEADIVYIDYNGRAKSVSFAIEMNLICGALSHTNIHYSTRKEPAYFEIFFDQMELLPAESEDEMNIVLNVRHLMYKQDMNSALHEIEEVSIIQLILLGDSERLAKFKIFYEKFICDKNDGNLSQSLISDENVSKVESTIDKPQESLINSVEEVAQHLEIEKCEKEIIDVPPPNFNEDEMKRSQETPSILEIVTQPKIENANCNPFKRSNTGTYGKSECNKSSLKRKRSFDVYELEDEESPLPSYKTYAEKMRKKRAHLSMENPQAIELTLNSSNPISSTENNAVKTPKIAKAKNQDDLKVTPHNSKQVNSVESKSKGFVKKLSVSVKRELKSRGRPKGALKKSTERTTDKLEEESEFKEM